MTALTGNSVGVVARVAALLAVLGALPPAHVGAQASLITMPKQAAQRAVGAENARLEGQMAQARAAQGQQIGPAQAAQQRAQAGGAPQSGAAKSGPPTPGVVQSGAARASDPGAAPGAPARAPGAAPLPDPGSVIMREVFDYNAEGRRDPFFSLMATGDLRPMLSDLRLTTILYDLSGRRPVAVMNDVSTNVQYRVTTGMMLGRMRVTAIKPRKVIFAIDEFGFSRADSLVLADKPQIRQ
jgi:hypothetical protein